MFESFPLRTDPLLDTVAGNLALSSSILTRAMLSCDYTRKRERVNPSLNQLEPISVQGSHVSIKYVYKRVFHRLVSCKYEKNYYFSHKKSYPS